MGDPILPLFILCASVVGIQILYLLNFLISFSKSTRVVEGSTPLTVIVCAQNELDNLHELVPALLSQDHPDFEVVIVDDRSSDGSYEFLLESAKRYPKLRIVSVAQTPRHINGKKFALTLGIMVALKRTIGVRVSDEVEVTGLDLALHAETAYHGVA